MVVVISSLYRVFTLRRRGGSLDIFSYTSAKIVFSHTDSGKLDLRLCQKKLLLL